jgi:hypothetical protein
MIHATHKRFMICIDNEGTPASLEIGKLYEVLPAEKPARDMGLIRVIDESGEDYLYPAAFFVNVRLPQSAKEAILRARS